ncbi:hypothetical protein [Lewinella sp. LCG006]|uniref:hypothetical protein n=1 Tax=Lewinella sp. LCG006 TaxID=3231911 RepID=UPI00345FBD5B
MAISSGLGALLGWDLPLPFLGILQGLLIFPIIECSWFWITNRLNDAIWHGALLVLAMLILGEWHFLTQLEMFFLVFIFTHLKISFLLFLVIKNNPAARNPNLPPINFVDRPCQQDQLAGRQVSDFVTKKNSVSLPARRACWQVSTSAAKKVKVRTNYSRLATSFIKTSLKLLNTS